MQDQRLNVALIGCGYWGRNYARLLINSKELVSEVYACDLDEDRLDAIKVNNGSDKLHCCSDYLKVLKDVDMCIIATPPPSHHQVIADCLNQGVHVLVEKPFVLDADAGRELVELAEANGVVLMVGHTFLFNPSVKVFKNLINDVDFGSLYYLHATRTNLGPIRSDVNVAWDLACHDISVFLHLLECLPERVSATGHSVLPRAPSTPNQYDVAFITLYFPDKVVAHIHCSWCQPDKCRKIVATGSKGRVEFDDMKRNNPVTVHKTKGDVHECGLSGGTVQQLVENDMSTPKVNIREPLRVQFEHFVDQVQNPVTTDRPISPGTFGLDVVRVLQAIDKSVAANGVPVAL